MCNHHEIEARDEAHAAVISKRQMVQGIAAGTIVAFTGAGMSSCATNPVTGRRQLSLVSNDALSTMAAESWAETKASEAVSTDPRYTSKIRQIGNRIADGANKGSEAWDYAVFDSDTKNAFVLPGNRVGFYKGMMDFTDNDDQVAAIMGHEVAHVTGTHAKERVSQAMLGNIAVQLTSVYSASRFQKACQEAVETGQITTRQQYNSCLSSASQKTQIVGALGSAALTYGVILPFSRAHESEADKYGALYMTKAGYDPMESVRLWEKMAAESTSRTPSWLSTHPDPADRARDLHDFIKEEGLA